MLVGQPECLFAVEESKDSLRRRGWTVQHDSQVAQFVRVITVGGVVALLPEIDEARLVKIDGNFVRDLVTDPVDRAMVESVNRIAHEMGLRTVAEFVESDQTLRCLNRIGVDYAQGYAIGRPEPFEDWLRRNPVAARAVAVAGVA